MAIKITEDCINCGACEPECPNKAIYEGGQEWSIKEGTQLTQGAFIRQNGEEINIEAAQPPIQNDVYFIVSDKCTECQGFHDEPQCAAVCPVDCCIPDELYQETVARLLEKKEKLHG